MLFLLFSHYFVVVTEIYIYIQYTGNEKKTMSSIFTLIEWFLSIHSYHCPWGEPSIRFLTDLFLYDFATTTKDALTLPSPSLYNTLHPSRPSNFLTLFFFVSINRTVLYTVFSISISISIL